MTNTTISQVKSKTWFPGNVNGNSRGQQIQNANNFSEVFDKTQNGTESQKEEYSVKTEDKDSIQNHANIQKNKSSEQLKGKTEVGKDKNSMEDVEEAVQTAANEMVESIAETFNISVEEVESVLETLGLTALDLLNTENLTSVVLALNPECDALTLMTNEELFTDLKGLMNTAQELTNQIAQNFNLTEEDMNAVLNAVKENANMQMPVEAAEIVSDTVTVEVDTADVTEVTQNTVRNETNAVKEINLTDTSTYDGTVIPKTESAESAQNTQSSSSETREDSGSYAGQNFNQNFVNQLAEAVENASDATGSYGVRGQDIINQITEHIRINVRPDTTEMELQLHPASLGSVKVQLVSTGGVLTAVFTTENEAVKTALESQLIQLKENFTQQGLKVESVEVNVSAQGFERSLDQQEQEQKQYENNSGRRGSRRIRLNGLDDMEDIFTEDMTADDRIVADMMIRNGNTVDYTV